MSNQTAVLVPQTYPALRKAVEVAMIKGQQVVEMARVHTYHETGRLIQEHVLLHQDRSGYGTGTFRRLSHDLKVDISVLQRCVQFVRAFPNPAPWRNLAWAHYRLLIPIADPKQRRALAIEANKQHWTVNELTQRVRALQPVERADQSRLLPPELLTPKRGTPGICRVVDVGDGPVVDLGFASYLDPDKGESFAVGDLVQLDPTGRGRVAPGATPADLFTFDVTVLKVVDGDTLWVKVRLWSRQWVKQKLRLRDLDCPEMNTAEGQAAKRFVEALMARTKSVTICTTKPDKYDRYLADVFLETKTGEAIFLNNALLAERHAVRKMAWQFTDWDGG